MEVKFMEAAAPLVQSVEVGAIVRFEAPGSRDSEGQTRVIPAVVLGQWPNGNLQLYAFHFEGAPSLVHSIPLDRVELVFSRAESDQIEERHAREITDLENRIAALEMKRAE